MTENNSSPHKEGMQSEHIVQPGQASIPYQQAGATLNGVAQQAGSSQTLSLNLLAHRGPLPPASELQAYANIKPEYADQIMEMALQNNATQNVTRRREQWFPFLRDMLALVIGAIFAFYALHTSIILAASGHKTLSIIVATTTLSIGVGAIILRKSVSPPPPGNSGSSN